MPYTRVSFDCSSSLDKPSATAPHIDYSQRICIFQQIRNLNVRADYACVFVVTILTHFIHCNANNSSEKKKKLREKRKEEEKRRENESKKEEKVEKKRKSTFSIHSQIRNKTHSTYRTRTWARISCLFQNTHMAH